MKKDQEVNDHRRRRLAVITATATVALVALGCFLYAAREYGPDRAAAWFDGIGVILAVLGGIAAVVAAWFTYPPYKAFLDERTRSPQIEMWLEVRDVVYANSPEPFTRVDDGGTWESKGGRFLIRPCLHNSGSGPLSGLLNVVLPVTVALNHPEGDRPPWRIITFPSSNMDIVPGQSTLVQWLAVEKEFRANGSWVSHLVVDTNRGDVPVLLDLTGDPDFDLKVRMTVKVP